MQLCRLFFPHSELPNLFRPRRVTRGSLSINSLSFSLMRFHTFQYSRCFIPATTKLWNELPSMTVEATELQKFKLGANAFLLGVDGLWWLVVCYMSLSFLYILNFVDFLSNFFKFFVVICLFYCCFLFFLKFSILTGLSSLMGPSGFWLLALTVGVCSLECS